MQADAKSLVERLAQLTVSDVTDQFDRLGVAAPLLARELRPVGRVRRFAGIAYCVEGRKLNAAGLVDAGRDELYDSLDERVPGGAVLLFATGGYDEAAVFGGSTAFALARRGVAGAIVDGLVRDTEDIARSGLPLLARGVSAIRFVGRFKVTAVDATMELRGLAGTVQARPGDLVLADQDGALVLPVTGAAELIEAAERAVAVDRRYKAELAGGTPATETARRKDKN